MSNELRPLRRPKKRADFKELLRIEPDSGTTDIRNVSSLHWKRWLGPENRCPFTSFSEKRHYQRRRRCGSLRTRAGRYSRSRPLDQLDQRQETQGNEVAVDIYTFLTPEPNAEVDRIHPKAMPVILTKTKERDA